MTAEQPGFHTHFGPLLLLRDNHSDCLLMKTPNTGASTLCSVCSRSRERTFTCPSSCILEYVILEIGIVNADFRRSVFAGFRLDGRQITTKHGAKASFNSLCQYALSACVRLSHQTLISVKWKTVPANSILWRDKSAFCTPSTISDLSSKKVFGGARQEHRASVRRRPRDQGVDRRQGIGSSRYAKHYTAFV